MKINMHYLIDKDEKRIILKNESPVYVEAMKWDLGRWKNVFIMSSYDGEKQEEFKVINGIIKKTHE